MSVIYTPRKPSLDGRLLAFPIAICALLLILFLRLWYFQVVRATDLSERADTSRQQSVLRPAPRGLIFDRNGVVIAGVKPQIVITGIYSVIRKNDWVIPKLALMLGVDVRKLQGKLLDARRTPELPTVLFVGADMHVGTKIAEAGDSLPGIGVDTAPMRYYPDTTSFTHALGYVRLPNDRDIKRIKEQGRKPSEFVGKGGIEQYYETDLMGEPGSERMEVDAKRRPIRVVGRDNAIPGKQLILSLDARLQKIATQVMSENQYVGGIVALDPRNGEVLCLVSGPTYDQTLMEGGISQQDWDMLQNDERHPLIARPIKASYSPGSTFKMVTSLAAYREGKFDPNRPVFCAGGYRLGKRFAKCLGFHGSITFHRALQKSCNTYFMDMGLRAGPEALRKAALDVGLGFRTGIDLLGESRGVVPTKEWVATHRKDGRWYGGDTLNFSIGQGDVRCTPLQMANLAALIGSEGVNYKPHLVHAVQEAGLKASGETTRSEVLHKVDASADFWKTIKASMFSVIDDGTAAGAKIPGLEWAGKTGSTEFLGGKKTHAWFMGFAPLKDPSIAICVVVEGAGHGGDVSAPIAREIVKRYFDDKSAGIAAAKKAAAASISAAPVASPATR